MDTRITNLVGLLMTFQPPTSVELHPAHVWDCENCGLENFCRSVRPSLTEEEVEELRDEHGIQPFDTGEFLTAPNVVICRYCGHKFETQFENE